MRVATNSETSNSEESDSAFSGEEDSEKEKQIDIVNKPDTRASRRNKELSKEGKITVVASTTTQRSRRKN